jgi:hypothetical protein
MEETENRAIALPVIMVKKVTSASLNKGINNWGCDKDSGSSGDQCFSSTSRKNIHRQM